MVSDRDSAHDARLTARAGAGDEEAFAALIEPFRTELRVHCYRMLASYQDAEDALQETMLAAWRSIAAFENRSSVRTWLYAIATNQCLNARRAQSRRAARESKVPPMQLPPPTHLGEVIWLEPMPDLLGGGHGEATPPDVAVEQAESVSLAFVVALQHLPPRQVAVLLLRDVLGFRAKEVAEIMGASLDSVNSALKRARSGLQVLRAERDAPYDAPVAGSRSEEELAARFADAYVTADVEALVALLTDDVFLSMPPLPHEYRGREAVVDFFETLFAVGRDYRLVPTRANGQPAFGLYAGGVDGRHHGTGFMVLTLRPHHIAGLTRFENAVFPWFGLPRTL